MKTLILLAHFIFYLFVNILINQVCAYGEEVRAKDKYIMKSIIIDGEKHTEDQDDRGIISLKELVSLSDIIVVGKIVTVDFGS